MTRSKQSDRLFVRSEYGATLGVLLTVSGYTALSTVFFATQALAQASPDRQRQIGSLSDPVNRLNELDERRADNEFLFASDPLKAYRQRLDDWQQSLYDRTGLRLGATITHVVTGVTDTFAGADDIGVAGTAVVVGSWELANKGTPTQGEFVFGIEGRWDYGTVGPEALGFESIGSAIGTADTFDEYDPTFIVREAFWRQGSPEAGWSYRVGKITPDGLLAASDYFDSTTAFLPTGSTGANAIGFPDSGFGLVGAWYPNPNFRIVGLISDANADRFNTGDVTAGDYFKAIEFQAHLLPPRSEDAGYSTLTFWHSDGTEDGLPINGSSGKKGGGFFLKIEEPLTRDGKNIGILRYGRSFDGAAVLYEEQASIHYVRKDPGDPFGLKNDLLGLAVNWIKPESSEGREEYDFEAFYRMPLAPTLDFSVAYQAIFDPAFNPDIDVSHVFSLRLRKTF